MALSHASRPDNLLAGYVLGLLSDDDRERVEEASIADDDVASRLRIIENDLVDGFVRGTLDETRRKHFESNYMSSPRRRDAVRSAAMFVAAVDRAALREAPAAAEPGTRSSRLVFTLAAVAAVLLVACGALLFDTVRTRNRFASVETARAALDQRAQDLE